MITNLNRKHKLKNNFIFVQMNNLENSLSQRKRSKSSFGRERSFHTRSAVLPSTSQGKPALSEYESSKPGRYSSFQSYSRPHSETRLSKRFVNRPDLDCEQHEGDNILPTPFKRTTSFQKSNPKDAANSDRLVREHIVRQFKEIRDKFDNDNVSFKEKSKYIDILYEVCCFFYDENSSLQKQSHDAQEEARKLEEEKQILECNVSDLENRISKMQDNLLLTENMDIRTLENSLTTLRQDIRQYDIVGEEKEVERFSPKNYKLSFSSNYHENSGESEDNQNKECSHRYQELLNEKFKLLEDFIFVLKKRNRRIEGETKRLGPVVSKYGSLNSLLNNKEQIEKENHELRKYIARFNSDVLLNRKILEVEDTFFLRTVIFALQNELGIHQKALEFFDLKRNPEFKPIVDTPDPNPSSHEIESLEKWAKEVWDINKQKRDEKIAKKKQEDPLYRPTDDEEGFEINQRAFRVAQETEKGESSINAVMNKLETENHFLKDQNQRLQNEVSHLKEFKSILSEISDESTSDKKLKIIKRLEKEMKTLQEEIEKINIDITKKENTFVLQDKMLKQKTEEKKTLEENNAEKTKWILHLRNSNRTLRSVVEAHKTSFQSIYYACLSFANMFIEKFASLKREMKPRRMVNFLYKDFLSEYVQATKATIKIQSCFRGYSSRNHLRNQGIKTYSPTSRSSTSKERKETQINSKPSTGVSKAMFQQTLDVWYNIMQVIMYGDRDSKDIRLFRQFIVSTKKEISNVLRSNTENDLNRMKQDISDLSQDILEFLTQVNSIKRLNRTTQTSLTNNTTHSAEVQCGVPSGDTKIEVRKKKSKKQK
eukprot:gb/GECH01012041.1/.p1 GENE.gb/GECH01012041.1/~~gb/GECH01012041.1/.p1  ORF type:complete len:826 (+),score=205.17 gb/GECH01012041.1/:1-2478(+)